MKKKVFGRKLSREKASRSALFLALTENLVTNGKIITTKAKAKSIIPLVDKLVTLGKKDNLSARRQILAKVHGNKKVAGLLWGDYAKIFKSRSGGFTKIMALPNRTGDMAEMVRMEFVEKLKTNEDIPAKSKTS